ncbi:MAG TPA: acyl-CoA dehydrogenase, partial [Psychrobacter sp.]|nr:acyl-CoA dehydrogenase [Psychrobacter sp.]
MSSDNLMFTATEHGQAMHAKVKAFIEKHIEPIEAQFWEECHKKNPDGNWENWEWPDAYDNLRKQAREAGLWNLFLPD